jgi:nitronate monooxygenase
VVRGLGWPAQFSGRALRNRFVENWHGREKDLRENASRELESYMRARETGDAENGGMFIGENAGLLRDVRAAGDIVSAIAAEAETLLMRR